jgi:hypothetical protein
LLCWGRSGAVGGGVVETAFGAATPVARSADLAERLESASCEVSSLRMSSRASMEVGNCGRSGIESSEH